MQIGNRWMLCEKRLASSFGACIDRWENVILDKTVFTLSVLPSFRHPVTFTITSFFFPLRNQR